jgi:hypothetical protein
MRISVLRFFLLCVAGVCFAQSKTGLASGDTDARMTAVMRDLYVRSAVDDSAVPRQHAAEQADVEYERRLFYDRAKHFVDLWTKMTKQMNDRNVVDVKLARKVSNAFHDLEKSDAWPVRAPK